MMREHYAAAFRLFSARAGLLTSILLTVGLPAGLLAGLIEGTSLTAAGHRVGAVDQVAAVANLFAPLAAGALIYALSRIQAGHSPRYSAALAVGFNSWGRLLVSRFIANVLIGLGFLVFVIPGVFLLIRYSLLEAAVVLEGAGISASRRRSMELTRGISWQIFAAGIVLAGILVIVFIPAFLLQALVAPLGLALVATITFCLLQIALAVFAVVLFSFYCQARASWPPTDAGGQAGRSHLVMVPIIVAFACLPAVRSSIADWNDVPTGAMTPSILPGDRIYIDMDAYDLRFPHTDWRLAHRGDPRRGDVAILRSPENGKRLVKRIVGLPGDVIELRGQHLYRNGEPAVYRELEGIEYPDADRPMALYVETVDGREHPIAISGRGPHPPGPFHVPEGAYFVLGDHRDNSRDSRYFGPVDRTAIIGRATAVALSFDRERGYKPRWGRFFSALQ